jgi:hypothetical protein
LTVDHYRPSLDDANLIEFALPTPWKDLIVACWDQAASKRPKFGEIVQRLEAIEKGL